MVGGKKGETDGEQHSVSLVNTSCEIFKRQDLPYVGTKNQHSAPARPTISSQVKCHSIKGNPRLKPAGEHGLRHLR